MLLTVPEASWEMIQWTNFPVYILDSEVYIYVFAWESLSAVYEFIYYIFCQRFKYIKNVEICYNPVICTALYKTDTAQDKIIFLSSKM